MSAELIWIVAGILLILSELIATGVVAVFFGSSAIITGLLLSAGLIESPAVQFSLFGTLSLLQLLLVRSRAQAWFQGHASAPGPARATFQDDIGDRVTVLEDFRQGSGRVLLNGVAWDASSSDELKAREVAWVVGNEGIRLKVSRLKPDEPAPRAA